MPVSSLAYERWTGRWSRLFVPMVIAAAGVKRGDRVLDVSTGTGEAAVFALRAVSRSGLVIGLDVAPEMVADKAPMWGAIAEELARMPPAQRAVLELPFSLSDPARPSARFTEAGFREVAIERVVGQDTIDRPCTIAPLWAGVVAGIGRRLRFENLPYVVEAANELPSQVGLDDLAKLSMCSQQPGMMRTCSASVCPPRSARRAF